MVLKHFYYIMKTSTGKLFENTVENIFLASDRFSDNRLDKSFMNVFNYNDYIKYYVNDVIDFETSIIKNENDIFLFKNFPDDNEREKRGKTEFCVVQKTLKRLEIFRIECRFENVAGTAYQKLNHAISSYRDFRHTSKETGYIIVYDGDYILNNQSIINDVITNIKHDFDILFLNVIEFNNFLSDYLTIMDKSETFKKYCELTKRI